jgi:hypothetical protein
VAAGGTDLLESIVQIAVAGRVAVAEVGNVVADEGNPDSRR